LTSHSRGPVRQRRDGGTGLAVAGNALLVLLVVATATIVVGYDRIGPRGRIAAALVAFAAFGGLFLPALRVQVLTTRRVAVAGALLVALAVLAPPAGSHDLWSYAAYGRLLSVHHASPFTHVPADFPHDPFLHLVARGWRHTGSVYGPGFVGLSAAGTAVTGPSELATRLFFQLVAALALVFIVLIVWRRTRSPVALAFVVLNPALILAVNGGHNDLLVGLALLGGTLLLEDGRPRRAGLVLAAGALVKLVLVLPLGALLLWTARRHRPRAAVEAGATAAAVLVAAYLMAGGPRAFGPLVHASKQHSRSSLWQIATQWLVGPLGIHHADQFRLEGAAALVLVAAVVLIVVIGMTRPASTGTRAGPGAGAGAIVAGASALVFLLSGAYILPWYSAWVIPVLGLVWYARVAVLAAAQAAFIGVAYAAPVLIGGGFATYAEKVLPLALPVALTYLAWSAWRDRLGLPIGASPGRSEIVPIRVPIAPR
jgi:Glycosyltransferase family 87